MRDDPLSQRKAEAKTERGGLVPENWVIPEGSLLSFKPFQQHKPMNVPT